jgi:hypothetical protein
MKKLILLFLFLFSFNLHSQNIVNAQITQMTESYIDVTLYPAIYENSVLSNVVFTLKWRNNQNISLGEPDIINSLLIKKSGPVLTNGNWKYQIYCGFSFVATEIKQSIIIRIPKSGNANLIITTDDFVKNIMINGDYYVSIGGQDVTGEILETKSFNYEENYNEYKMYFDQKFNRFLFEVNGVFLTTFGQRIEILDRTNLLLVKKIN